MCRTEFFFFKDVSRLEEGEGRAHRYCMNVCALGGKERGGLRPEMKVERNKRFGFNLVERRVSLRSLAEGVTLAAQRLCTKAPRAQVTVPFNLDNAAPDLNLTHFRQHIASLSPASKCVNLMFITNIFYFCRPEVIIS